MTGENGVLVTALFKKRTRTFVRSVKALSAYFPERLHKVFVYNYSSVLEKEWIVLARNFFYFTKL